MEAGADHRQHEIRILERPRLDDPAQRPGCIDQQSVIRADEDVTPGDLQADRQSLGPDTRIDDCDVDPDGHVLQGEHQGARAVPDRVARHLVVDVDDVRVRADGEHHPAADGGRGRPEVGEERDDGAHRRMVPSVLRPSAVCSDAGPGERRSGAGRRFGAAST